MNEFLRQLCKYNINMRTKKDSLGCLCIYFDKGDLRYQQTIAVNYACDRKMNLDYILNKWLNDFISICIREGLISEEFI